MMENIVINNKAICLHYATRRAYQNKKLNGLKKMETSFIRGLKQVLSKKFRYRIVADQSFGNQRFINLCQENNFEFVAKINSNFRIKDLENNQKNLQEFDKINLKKLELYVNSWDQNIKIENQF